MFAFSQEMWNGKNLNLFKLLQKFTALSYVIKIEKQVAFTYMLDTIY